MGFKAGDILQNKISIILGIPRGATTFYYDMDRHIVGAHWDLPEVVERKKSAKSSIKDEISKRKPIEELYLPFSLHNLSLPAYPGYIHPKWEQMDVYVNDPDSGRPCYAEVPPDFHNHGRYSLIDASTNNVREMQADRWSRARMIFLLDDRLPGKIILPGEIKGRAICFLHSRLKNPSKVVRSDKEVMNRPEWVKVIVQLELPYGLSIYLPTRYLEYASKN